jgi:hypothetical protein
MTRVRYPAVQDFSILHSVQTDSGTHPVFYLQWVSGALSLGVKSPGRGAGHSSLSGAEDKKGGAMSLLPPYVLMA